MSFKIIIIIICVCVGEKTTTTPSPTSHLRWVLSFYPGFQEHSWRHQVYLCLVNLHEQAFTCWAILPTSLDIVLDGTWFYVLSVPVPFLRYQWIWHPWRLQHVRLRMLTGICFILKTALGLIAIAQRISLILSVKGCLTYLKLCLSLPSISVSKYQCFSDLQFLYMTPFSTSVFFPLGLWLLLSLTLVILHFLHMYLFSDGCWLMTALEACVRGWMWHIWMREFTAFNP